MRLEKIKLVGFKSFVDPTVVHFSKPLTGIVGPNGCGKSNIIDAVRWVMGESSAKQLRGESITDVIFNGSTFRKPIGQASIELIFDNSDGTLGGEYATYNQIAIKRQVSREGISNYYLNNTKCRRRDITDIFLGTGLGPRSYSIIEQGMISEIIEAKPEELRAYIEEVAGISKYKERRRETENRIGHTLENLSRVNDIRTELDQQLEHLRKQARAAEKYKLLKEEERSFKAQLLALKWRDLESEGEQFAATLRKQEVVLESHHADLQKIDTDNERLLSQRTELSEKLNGVQTQFYEVGNEISRLEQEINYQRERRQQLEFDLRQADEGLKNIASNLSNDQGQKETIEQELACLSPRIEQLRLDLASAEQTLRQAEKTMQLWQARWDEFNQHSAETAQKAKVEQTRIQHFETQELQATQKGEKLRQELAGLENIEGYIQEHQQLQARIETAKTDIETHLREIKNCHEQVNQYQHQRKQLEDELHRIQEDLRFKKGRHTSLEALQTIALGKKETQAAAWLEKHQLNHYSRLAELLKVDTGWEKAVETVLSTHLSAIQVERVEDILQSFDTIPNISVSFFDVPKGEPSMSDAPLFNQLLLDKVQSTLPLRNWLKNIYTAESFQEALRMKGLLTEKDSIITRDGIWLGKNWLRIERQQDAKSGVLQREQELRALKKEIQEISEGVHSREKQLDEVRQRLHQTEMVRATHQEDLNKNQKQQTELQSKSHTLQTKIQQVSQRRDHLTHELSELAVQLQAFHESLGQARQIWEQVLHKMEIDKTDREGLLREKEVSQSTLNDARLRTHRHQEELHSLHLQFESSKTLLTSLKQAIDRSNLQAQTLTAKRAQLIDSLSQGDLPVVEMKTQLEGALDRRASVEKTLTAAKQDIDNLDYAIQECSQNRHKMDEAIQQARNYLEDIRLQTREVKVRQKTIEEQMAEKQLDLSMVVQNLSEEANEDMWQAEIEKIALRISRLGPINLAAIEELDQQQQRKTYLDSQYADLQEALNILQNAIKKIDQETRSRFRETFDTVNQNFQVLFPKVFGGGTAYLELTSEDLLMSGVSVMAKPPGKRVSSIHLLSGGEKALTAVSLIFAMFQLNPSPFCLLDEVDAPLDDSNVVRFCELVKEMAQTVQFIFISHNKIAIEMAHQLTGVTMNEPGVSRIVAVDIDEAMAMAES